MKLLGRDIPTGALVARIEERLRVRGLPTSEAAQVPDDGVEPRVDPLSFNMHALEDNADTTRALPLHTHRGGAGRVVLLAKWAFRKSCQVLINETLGRQRVFNGLVRDSYAQLSAEVLRLRREVDMLRAQAARTPQVEAPRPPKLAPDTGSERPPKPPPHGEHARPPKPPPDIDYGRPLKPPHGEHARPLKPPPDIDYGRPLKPPHGEHARPPKPPPAIDSGRPPKPPHGEHARPPEAGPGRSRPGDKARKQARASAAEQEPQAASRSPAPPTPPGALAPRGSAANAARPSGRAPREPTASAPRPSKPPRAPLEQTPRPEGGAPPAASRRSRAKRGGAKKP
ncbi:hypothetical protein [Corallococcus sp. Z5C101001]|uniref:hypothetical protein n=1 Tax=Corallococcus sp. Z5C101001 TaxID=2596829 RepID=UPI002107DFCB|nr:hypothetical protein [Corallococcus sp. Z5C101001]